MIHRLLNIIFCCLIVLNISGQNHWLYNQSSIQSNKIDPSFIPKTKTQILLPSFDLDFSSNGLKLNSFIKAEGRELVIDGDILINNINENKLHLAAEVDVFGYGKKISNGYIHGGYSVRSLSNIVLDKELVTLLLKGNEPFIGTEVDFNLNLAMQSYNQIYVGYAQRFGKISVGGKLKYLNGISSLNTNDSKIKFRTALNNFETQIANDINIYSSTSFDLETTPSIPSPQLYFSGNSGFGLDIGGSIELSSKSSITLGIIDIGKINWTDKVYVYNNTKTGIIKGLNIEDVIDGKNLSIEDTLKNIFELINNNSASYVTQLPQTVTLGGRHSTNGYSLSVLLSSRKLPYGRQNSLSIMASKELGKILDLGTSVTIRDKGAYLGFYGGLKIKGVNFYLSTQNALIGAGLKYQDVVNVQSGFYLAFGKVKIRVNEEY
jgi:hypothetical protein